MSDLNQFGRAAKLLVVRPGQAGNNPSAFVPGSTIDLSELHFTFRTAQLDEQSPNNCSVRVYNLSKDTVNTITKLEYSRIILQAGYTDVGVGSIFDGTIKWFKIGRENNKDSYLDILAADGDVAYNYAFINQTLAAGSTPKQRMAAAIGALAKKGLIGGDMMEATGGILPRGKVLFGMAQAALRQEVQSVGATWSIDDGRINVTPLNGYRPGDVVVLNALTGLIGIPEQTQEGIHARCLLNPRLVVGGRVQIDNESVNRLIQQNPTNARVAYNSYTNLLQLASVTTDGVYRLYCVEHEGDTRGTPWYSNLTCLSINPATKMVQPYG